VKPLILVQTWCEIDPTLNVRIDRETGQAVANGGDVLIRVSPLGRFGVEAALGLAGFEVVAFAVGGDHEAALRHALGAGASRAVQLATERDGIGGLAGWLGDQAPALVIADRTAGLLAGRLGWAHLAGLDELRVSEGRLHAIRHLGRGDRERVSAALPAVVRLSGESLRTRYVSRDRLRLAAGREIERATLPSDGAPFQDAAPGPLQLARPRTRLGKAAPQAAESGLDRLKALMGMGQGPARPSEPASETPGEMAEAFVRYLIHHDLIDKRDRRSR
jgi:electron transfer flavoprotein alpha/beta subunit